MRLLGSWLILLPLVGDDVLVEADVRACTVYGYMSMDRGNEALLSSFEDWDFVVSKR